MHDKEVGLVGLLGTLQKAREAVHAELQRVQAQHLDRAGTLQLLEATRALADQAQELSLKIEDIVQDEAPLNQANDLVAFFWWAEEAIEATLGLSRRS